MNTFDHNLAFFKTESEAISELVAQKANDYGPTFHHNVDKYGAVVYFLRIGDKLGRLENALLKQQTLLVDESIDDTLSDIIGYTLLMKQYLKEWNVHEPIK